MMYHCRLFDRRRSEHYIEGGSLKDAAERYVLTCITDLQKGRIYFVHVQSCYNCTALVNPAGSVKLFRIHVLIDREDESKFYTREAMIS